MKTIIDNVRVFDGLGFTGHTRVAFEDGVLCDATGDGIVVDGQGGTLLPGLIDCHVHLDSPDNLKAAADHGVTTMLEMVSQGVDGYKNRPGVSGVRTCYTCAIWPMMNAGAFVAAQVARGADYIKVIIEDPPTMSPRALSAKSVRAIVKAAHQREKLVVAHAVTVSTYQMAVDAGVDIITHMPLDVPLPEALVAQMAAQETKTIPTLVMMKGIANARGNPAHYHNAQQSMRALLAAGIPVMAGTDANHASYAPVNIDHGAGLQEELRLLSAVGMSPAQVLQSATGLPARIFGFQDIGILEPGRRADLLLVFGDPTADIRAVMNVQKIWIGGVEVE